MSDLNENPAETPELRDADESAVRTLLTRAHRPPRIRPAARRAILARLQEKQRPQTAKKPIARRGDGRRGMWVAVLAAAALVVLWLRPAAAPVFLDNPGPVPKVVALAHGATLILDGGTHVVERRAGELELLAGRALLDVPMGTNYELSSAEGRVATAGARIIVRRQDGETSAAVARGHIRAHGGGQVVSIRAGDQATLVSGQAPTGATAPRLTYLAAWARDALTARAEGAETPIRRGNLVARVPDSSTDWPLAMRKLTVDVVVEDGAVRTTFDHTFFNHVNRDLEGVYSFALPADAAVSRLAMYVDGTLMEGGVIERDRGRNVYEDIVYRRRDPALLEWMRGNELKVRIFPLRARTEKRILMSYTQLLERLYDSERLVVPIPDIDEPVGAVAYRVRIRNGERYAISSTSHEWTITDDGADRIATFEATDHAIGRDLVVELAEREKRETRTRTFSDDDATYLLTAAQPTLHGARNDAAPRDWVILYDTSASRDAATMSAQERMLMALVSELDTHDRFSVMAFDATQRVMSGGFVQAGTFDPATLKAFFEKEGRGGVGHTDFAAAVTRAHALLGDRAGDIAYLGDGLPTAGASEPAALRALVTQVADRRFVAMGIGDAVDGNLLRDLADASGGSFVSIAAGEDLRWRAFDLIAELHMPRIRDVEARVIDADGEAIGGEVHVDAQVSGGQDIVVVARLPKGRDAAVVELGGNVNGKPWTHRVNVAAAPGGAKFLPRVWARRQVAAWVRADAKAHAEQITKLGLENFLVTPTTSLLVLETEADYKKHRVVRPSADAWAFYDAPASIEVRREPVAGAATPFGAPVYRTRRYNRGWTMEESLFTDFTTTVTGLLIPSFELSPMTGEVNGAAWTRAPSPIRSPPASKRLEAKNTGKRVFFAARGPVDGRTGNRQSRFRDNGRLALSSWGGYLGPGWLSFAHQMNDLSQFVPQLFADAVDGERADAQRGRDEGKTASMTPDARALLDDMRRPPVSLEGLAGRRVEVTATGIRITQRTSFGLTEHLQIEGGRLEGAYPDFELSTSRDIRGAILSALQIHAPFATPLVSELEGFYNVELVSARTIRITPTSGGPATEITLDDRGRVVRHESAGNVTTFVWDKDKLTIARPRGAQEVLRIGSDAVVFPSIEASWTKLRLPLVELEASERNVAAQEHGSAAWRAAQAQRLATVVATGGDSWPVIDELRSATLSPTRAELVLASGGALPQEAKWLSTDDPIGAYIVAAHRHDTVAMAKVAGGTGPIANLAAVRRAMDAGTDLTEALTLFDELSKRRIAPSVRLAVLQQLRHRGFDDDVVDALLTRFGTLGADPHVEIAAQMQAATWAAQWERWVDAETRMVAAFERADALKLYPAVDWRVARAFPQSSAGITTPFESFLRTRRTRLLADGSQEALVAALYMLDAHAKPADLNPVIAVLARQDIDDPTLAESVARRFLARGFTREAENTVLAHLEGPRAFAMRILAADIAAADHRHRVAAARFSSALETSDAIPLGELRSLYKKHFEALVAAARAERLDHLDDALAVAAMWRAEDADNPDLDVLVFDALTHFGLDDEASRYLSSIIERHPAEGASYETVARAHAKHGHFATAERTIARAIEVEPTNPTWLLTQADMLEALGDKSGAAAAIQRVVTGEWQDRFNREVEAAKGRLGR